MVDVLKRSIPTSIERTDKRTLECRFAPFGVTANVFDPLPDGNVERYRESFAPSVFDRQLAAAEKGHGVLQRITFVDEHHEGLGKVGFTTMLRKASDGIYGAVRILPSRIDDVDAMLEEGINQLSVEFFPHRGGTRVLPDGVKLRCDAHLFRVALAAQGAYEGSEVLAAREAESMVAEVDAEYTGYVDELDQFLAEANAKQAEWAKRLTSTP